MLEYFTPTTLEEMYKNLDESRLSYVKYCDIPEQLAKYQMLNEAMQKIEEQYIALTGKALWAKVAMQSH